MKSKEESDRAALCDAAFISLLKCGQNAVVLNINGSTWMDVSQKKRIVQNGFQQKITNSVILDCELTHKISFFRPDNKGVAAFFS
jgi:hypothetical protein